MTREELEQAIRAAIDTGWSQGDEGPEFTDSRAIDAVMNIPAISAVADKRPALVMAAVHVLTMRVHMEQEIDWKREGMNLINLALNGRPLP